MSNSISPSYLTTKSTGLEVESTAMNNSGLPVLTASTASSIDSSNRSVISPQIEDDDNTIKKLRAARVLSKRFERVTDHLENFLRVHVTINQPKSSFDIIVDKRNTVEYLAHQIEAE